MLTDRDIPGWFPDVNRNHLIKLIHDHMVKTVLEIGSFLGKSAVFFAQRVSLVYCIDPFQVDGNTPAEEIHELERLGMPANWYAVFVDNIRQSGSAGKVQAIQGKSGLFGRTPPLWPIEWPQSFDLIYIDGDHSYEAVKQDIEVFALHARIICGDDYETSPGVTRAVDETWKDPPACKAGPFWWVIR